MPITSSKRRTLAARGWVAVLAVGLCAMLAAPAEALPAKFWGIVPQAQPTVQQLQRVKRGGVRAIRIGIPWDGVMPTRGGGPQWGGVDDQFRAAAGAGLDVLPFLYGAPAWAVHPVVVDRSNGTTAPRTLPVKNGKQRRAWKAFVTAAVKRYGRHGRFWAQNPGLRSRPVRTWQIWNEENFLYFVAHPSPSDYGKLVKLSHQAIAKVDHRAKILLGGLFAFPALATRKGHSSKAWFSTNFLNGMYRSTRGIKSKFDGIALHPYVRNYNRLRPDINAVRAALKRNHDARKGLWITELGWSSMRHGSPFAKGPKGQAKQLRKSLSLLRKNQRRWRLRQVFWFSLDDLAGSCNFCDGSGLFGAGFQPKPAWYAFVHFTGGKP